MGLGIGEVLLFEGAEMSGCMVRSVNSVSVEMNERLFTWVGTML